MQALALLPGLDIDGVIVVADAETIEERSRDRYMSDTILRQLADADLVLLNKIDLVPEQRVRDVTSWLAAQAPRARTLPVHNARISVEVALGLHTDRRGARGSARPHDTSQYESFSVALDKRADGPKLIQELADPRLGILRAKGFIRDGVGQRLALHVVGARVNVSPAPAGEGDPAKLVFIGLAGQLDRNAILAAVAATAIAD